MSQKPAPMTCSLSSLLDLLTRPFSNLSRLVVTGDPAFSWSMTLPKRMAYDHFSKGTPNFAKLTSCPATTFTKPRVPLSYLQSLRIVFEEDGPPQSNRRSIQTIVQNASVLPELENIGILSFTFRPGVYNQNLDSLDMATLTQLFQMAPKLQRIRLELPASYLENFLAALSHAPLLHEIIIFLDNPVLDHFQSRTRYIWKSYTKELAIRIAHVCPRLRIASIRSKLQSGACMRINRSSDGSVQGVIPRCQW
ncbi:hypothetical protein B0J17DRAFT_711217 [Rhizoctonia solani]|nr:hypothetical protein B0J17DRAFT_711217 [Rhizoctonia solani]